MGVLSVAGAGGAPADSVSAASDGARSMIDAASMFSMPAEPNAASQTTTQLGRTTVRHRAATVANRRQFMIPASKAQPRARLAKYPTPQPFLIARRTQWRRPRGVRLFWKLLYECNALPG